MGNPSVADDTDITWVAPRGRTKHEVAMPGWGVALGRGLSMRCPACGEASAFEGYLKVRRECASCAAPLGRVPCDDAPIYLTLVIALHIVILLMVFTDYDGGMSWVASLFIFVPLTLALILLMMRPIKGATLAIMLKVNLLRPAPRVVPSGNG